MSDYTLLVGDALETLRTLPSDSVHCCVSSPPYFGLRSYLPSDHPDKALELGGEETPDAYVARLVEVFREVRRVLHPSGVCFLNLGDSYANFNHAPGGKSNGYVSNHKGAMDGIKPHSGTIPANCKPKDLIGIPWLVAFALRADGWWLRQEIIWHKTAPMPESVTDRCTKAHEQVFLLAKSERYFFDHVAIAEPAVGNDPGNLTHKHQNGAGIILGRKSDVNGGLMNVGAASTRNKRSVWTLSPEQFSGAHYAVMPTALVTPCVLSGSSAHGCCSKCGNPYERVVERETTGRAATASTLEDGIHERSSAKSLAQKRQAYRAMGLEGPPAPVTTGWTATCTCSAPVQPCVVLDPFFGSGTVAKVALTHGRHFVGIDLDPRNLELATQRIEQTQPLLFSL